MLLLALLLFVLPVVIPVMLGWGKVVMGYFLCWFSLITFAVTLVFSALLTAIIYPPQVIKSWVMFDSFVLAAGNSIEIGRGDINVYDVLPSVPAKRIPEFPGIQQPFNSGSGVQQPFNTAPAQKAPSHSGSNAFAVLIPYLLILDIIYACIYFPFQHGNIIVWVLMLTAFVLNAVMWINFFGADLGTSNSNSIGQYVNGFWRSSSQEEPMLGDGGYYGNGYPKDGYGNPSTGKLYKVNPDEHYLPDGSLWRNPEKLRHPR